MVRYVEFCAVLSSVGLPVTLKGDWDSAVFELVAE